MLNRLGRVALLAMMTVMATAGPFGLTAQEPAQPVAPPQPEQPAPAQPSETKPEETKPEEPKAEEPKPEGPKPAEPKPEETKPEETKPAPPAEMKPEQPAPPAPPAPASAEPKPEEPKPEEPKPEEPKPDAPKPEEPKTTEPMKTEEPPPPPPPPAEPMKAETPAPPPEPSPAPAATPAEPAPLVGIDQRIKDWMTIWAAPGLAMAVIKDDKTFYTKGYGVREVGKDQPVDEHTVFAIASMTKAFTAASLAILVDEGKLGWDDKMIDRLNGFRLTDTFRTNEATVRDLLSHRTAVERADLAAYSSNFTEDELFSRLRHLRSIGPFRAKFSYQNQLYMAAGRLIRQITGDPWARFVTQRLLLPLQLTETYTSLIGLVMSERSDVARPHYRHNGDSAPLPYHEIDATAPAVAIYSSVSDLGRWARFQLGRGELEGQRLISEPVFKTMHTPQTIIDLDDSVRPAFPDAHFLSYGMGWFLHDYHGKLIIEHGGNIDGMTSMIALVPEENLAVVILCNLDNTRVPHAVKNLVIDRFLGLPDRDWNAEFLEMVKKASVPIIEKEKLWDEKHVEGTTPSMPLDAYAGTYRSDLYPDVVIENHEGGLQARFGSTFSGALEHWQHDTFVARWDQPLYQRMPRMFMTFQFTADGGIARLSLESVSPSFGDGLAFKRVK